MKLTGSCILAALIAAAAAGEAAHARGSAAPARSGQGLVEEIADIVERKFYSAARLEEVGWRDRVARSREEFAAARGDAERATVLRGLVAALRTSHTVWYPRSDPAYWDMASLFEPLLQRVCPKEVAPPLPIQRDGIGVFWKQVEGEWFVGGVFAGGPA